MKTSNILDILSSYLLPLPPPSPCPLPPGQVSPAPSYPHKLVKFTDQFALKDDYTNNNYKQAENKVEYRHNLLRNLLQELKSLRNKKVEFVSEKFV
jgi:hypothetical protein